MKNSLRPSPLPQARAFVAAQPGSGGACAGLSTAEPAAASLRVREPAVAGVFYPRDPAVLGRVIDEQLAAAATRREGVPRALICPHAGYIYSGAVAASGFHLLQGAAYETVIVLAPSHYAVLATASVSDADVYRTPLGDVPISPKARVLVQHPPFALAPACCVQRPGWADQSSRAPPAPGEERADTWEHADEVEIPFLQRVLREFAVLPVVCGEVDPAQAARSLARILDERTLIVVSSDLSHCHSYAEARRRDQQCVQAICALDLARAARQEACGLIPILTLLHVAKERGWRPVLLDCRNSGDTAGDRSRVVGYAAVAFYEAEPGGLADAERRLLLDLARRAVREVATSGRFPDPPAGPLAPALAEPRGCFVTLTRHGALRGCVGNLQPHWPLHRAVVENARGAAVRDTRFRPVAPDEVDALEIEISILTTPEPLTFSTSEQLLRRLQPGRDGVVLKIGERVATYLPKVWDHLPDPRDFLNSLAEKAGCAPEAWQEPGAAVQVYRVETFRESDPPA